MEVKIVHKSFYKFIKQCRINANITIESASVALNISKRNLSYYEDGTYPVPDDVAFMMSEVYQAPIIKYLWLRNCRCGALLPEIDDKDFAENILSLAVNFKLSNDCLNDLMSIGADGKVDTKEKPKYTRILKVFRRLATDMILLPFHKIKKPNRPADGSTFK